MSLPGRQVRRGQRARRLCGLVAPPRRGFKTIIILHIAIDYYLIYDIIIIAHLCETVYNGGATSTQFCDNENTIMKKY